MNKKLTLKLLLSLLLSLSLISCGQKDNISSSNKSNNETQSSIKKEENNENQDNASDVKEENNENQGNASNVKEDNNENTQQNTQLDVNQGLTEEEYYIIIKEAKKRQQDYIDSIDDPKVKQSVQTSYSAAIAESTALYIKYPEDTDTIDAALKRVLNGE